MGEQRAVEAIVTAASLLGEGMAIEWRREGKREKKMKKKLLL